MTLPPRALAAALCALALACRRAPDPRPVAPTTTPVTVLDAAALAPDDAAPSAPREAVVDEAMLAADLARIAIPRHHRVAPDGLCDVAAYLQMEFERAGFSVTRQRVEFRGAAADNVIAERPGTESARVVLATAHYDAVPGTSGADDNGSGTAALVALARALGPARTAAAVRLVAFAFEEEGMVGSRHYVRAISREERGKIAGVFNLDMIGYTTTAPGSQRVYPDWLPHRETNPGSSVGDFISVVGTGKDGALLAALDRARGCEPALRAEVYRVRRPYSRIPRDFLRSDHAPFWRANIPAVVLDDTAELRTPHYHTPTDTVATLDLAFAARVVRWVGSAALDLAGRDPATPRCVPGQSPATLP